jgi:hypothetical protein
MKLSIIGEFRIIITLNLLRIIKKYIFLIALIKEI